MQSSLFYDGVVLSQALDTGVTSPVALPSEKSHLDCIAVSAIQHKNAAQHAEIFAHVVMHWRCCHFAGHVPHVGMHW